MEAYIKDARTFITTSHNLVLDYTIKQSIYDEVSQVIIETPTMLPKEGDIIYLDGKRFFGVIKTVSPDHGKTELAVNQIITLFSREIFYSDMDFTYLEDNLKTLIDENYTNCVDAFYAMPYLSVRASTHTAAQLRPDLENNIYAVKDYASKMRRLYNIFCEWSISRDTLTLDIVQRYLETKNIDFSNPAYTITAQDFSSKTVSKITTFCEENNQTKEWILLKDGSIVNTAPEVGRVEGEWKPLVVSKEEDIDNDVKDEFAKNEYSHKIEFQAPIDTKFNLYDKLKIKLDNKIFSSYVSGITESKGSNVIDIQCGELQMQYPYLELL